jgi:hypothetical protein
MTTALLLYNQALMHLGQRKLASTSEDQEGRYYLDEIYSDSLNYCLRQAPWNFAMRAVEIDSDLTPTFHYSYGFAKPADWIRTHLLSDNEGFDPPLLDYQDQGGYWLANVDPLYARYVSTTRGTDVSLFPVDYADYVAAFLASRIYKRITGNGEDEVTNFEKRKVRPALRRAMANDAMDQPPGFAPTSSWVRARGDGDAQRGLRSRLIG